MVLEGHATSSARELVVLIEGRVAGTLGLTKGGSLVFAYDPSYAGKPLSLSMPVSNRTYPEKTVRPFLFGLLPDNRAVRASVARRFETGPDNVLVLLAHLGLDCPGGVQFCTARQVDEVIRRPETYEPIDNEGIARRLHNLRADEEESWIGALEHWSLGGNQGKFALAWHNGQWCECRGAAPTTHIFKNGVAGFKLQALNEYICMKLALACGIPAARVTYQLFDCEPAIIIERYDRIVAPNGLTARLHQEDFCQALGVMPDHKYTSDGGPNTRDVLALLATLDTPREHIGMFTKMLFFNCLIGAPDAHAKNYSLLLRANGNAELAPLYDVATGLVYESLRRDGRLAMSIGGENRFGRMSKAALDRYARNGAIERFGYDGQRCADMMANLADCIPDALKTVFDETTGVPGIDELREHMEPRIVENCRSIRAAL